jgi:hypothetical protein
MNILRAPVPTSVHKDDVNNNNLQQYTPYHKINGVMVIDTTWWNSLTMGIQQTIQRIVPDHVIGEVKVPHDVKDDVDYKNMYHAYFSGFDYNCWYSPTITNGPQKVSLVKVPNHMKPILKGRAIVGSLNLPLQEEMKDLHDEIHKVMEPDVSYFMRMSSTSGKNEVPIRPFNNALEVMQALVRNPLFMRQEFNEMEKDSYIILVPWNHRMESKTEFRIFVVDGKLTCASQQYWGRLFNYSVEELETIQRSLSNLKFLNDLPYKDFTGDVWIDFETSECHLVECNPFGAHSGAGAALYNWDSDFLLMNGLEGPPQLRYQSVVNI